MLLFSPYKAPHSPKERVLVWTTAYRARGSSPLSLPHSLPHPPGYRLFLSLEVPERM